MCCALCVLCCVLCDVVWCVLCVVCACVVCCMCMCCVLCVVIFMSLTVCLSVCVSVCLTVCLCVCLSILLSVYPAHPAYPLTLQVVAGSAAEREGVLPGDHIVAVEGNRVDSYALFLEVRGGEDRGERGGGWRERERRGNKKG
jgi:hypothetical protein